MYNAHQVKHNTYLNPIIIYKYTTCIYLWYHTCKAYRANITNATHNFFGRVAAFATRSNIDCYGYWNRQLCSNMTTGKKNGLKNRHNVKDNKKKKTSKNWKLMKLYMCMYVCMYADINTHIHTHTYIHTHTHTHIYIYIYIYIRNYNQNGYSRIFIPSYPRTSDILEPKIGPLSYPVHPCTHLHSPEVGKTTNGIAYQRVPLRIFTLHQIIYLITNVCR